MNDTEAARAKLLSLVRRAEHTSCWEWLGAKDKDGYGKVWLLGSNKRSHRAAYEIMCGPIPAGAVVRHTCDNPSCCNPDHLVTGSHADNVADREARGRTARGDRTGARRYPEKYGHVFVGRKPRTFEHQGSRKTIKQLAAETGLSVSLLSQRLGKGWPVERAIAPVDARFSRRAPNSFAESGTGVNTVMVRVRKAK